MYRNCFQHSEHFLYTLCSPPCSAKRRASDKDLPVLFNMEMASLYIFTYLFLPFVEVDCVFAGDNLAHGGSLLFLRHFDCSGKNIQNSLLTLSFVKEHFIHLISLVGSGKNILHF